MYALVDAADPRHDEARGALGTLTDARLLTHNYVVLETTSLVLRRLGLDAVRDLLERLLAPVDIVWVDADLHGVAVSALLASAQREISLVDRVSFELMRRRQIDGAFAFDRDFADHGFTTIP